MLRARLLALSAITALLVAAPVAAQAAHSDTEGFYIGAQGGFNHLQDGDFNRAGVSQSGDFDNGWTGLANLGYDWGNSWRTEAEVNFRNNGVDSITSGGVTTTTGHLRSWGVMANALYDFDTNSDWTPYLGAGLGWASVKANNVLLPTGQTVNDTDGNFAYQGIVGVAYKLTDAVDINANYRYFATTDPKWKDTGGTRVDGEYRNHSVLVGFRYNFGAPAPMAKPVAAKPAKSYLVFFDFDSDVLTDEAKDILAAAAKNAKTYDPAMINVTGHTDTSGSQSYNDDLSKRRAAAVEKELVRLGLQASEIATRGVGEGDLLVPTADGVKEAQNRRAVILVK